MRLALAYFSCERVAVAFRRDNTLGFRNVNSFVAAVLRPARSRVYASPFTLPCPSQDSLPAGAVSPFAGRVSHPLDDVPNFMNSSHYSLLSDQPFLVALSHRFFCPCSAFFTRPFQRKAIERDDPYAARPHAMKKLPANGVAFLTLPALSAREALIDLLGQRR